MEPFEDTRSIRPSRVLLAVVSVAIVGIVVGVLVGGYVTASDTPDSETFATETAIDDDRIVHAFAPDVDEHYGYRASFRILQEGTEIRNVEDEAYELAEDDPLVVVIEDRDSGATYQVEMTIRDDAGEVVYDGTLVVSGSDSGSDSEADSE